MLWNPLRRRRGFSLVEMLVIIGLLAFLAGILLYSVQRVRVAAARVGCTNNLRQLGIAMHNINDTYKVMPSIAGPFPANTKNYGTLYYHMLPFIEQQPVWAASRNYVWNNGTYSKPIPTFICPDDASAPPHNKYKDWLATCNYPANWQVFGKPGASIPRTFQDGTAQTLMFAERFQMCNGTPCAWGYPGISSWSPTFAYYSHGKFQTQPVQDQCNPALAQSVHEGGIPVCLGDGSVRHLSSQISPQTWWYACTPAGGEAMPADWNQ